MTREDKDDESGEPNTAYAVPFDCSASFENKYQVNHLECSRCIQYNNFRTELQLKEESCSLLKYTVVEEDIAIAMSHFSLSILHADKFLDWVASVHINKKVRKKSSEKSSICVS